MFPMMRRFALYGFLKNQRYFEPFLLLVFLDKGLSYLQIGTLMSVREATVIFTEIPSGALADVYGRRGTMVASFVAYIVSFVLFAGANHYAALAAAMVLFGIGEAFRSGTHKSMIFTWLRSQGRESERTEFYGYTRSWSKFGSAISAVLAAVFVYVSSSYHWVFYACIVPYLLGIANFLTYPSTVEDPSPEKRNFLRHLWSTFTASVRKPELRRLYAESMGFEGMFHAAKDYIQPVVAVAVLGSLAVGGAAMGGGETAVSVSAASGQGAGALGFISDSLSGLSPEQRNAVALAPVYIVLFLLAGVASRRSHGFAKRHTSDDAAATSLWFIVLGVFSVIAVCGYFSWSPLLVLAFLVFHVAQNLWRPILITRFDQHGGDWQGATLLSVESQARRVATLVLAPAMGWCVDTVQRQGWGGEFWPVGAFGVVIAAVFVLRRR